MHRPHPRIHDFRLQLRELIDSEQRNRGLGTRDMICLMQNHVSLPDFYRVPAAELAAAIMNEETDTGLAAELQEAVKAVYGAWIRERLREI